MGGIILCFILPFDRITDAIKAFRKHKSSVLVETLFSNFELQSSYFFFSGPELQNIGYTN